MDTQTTEVIAPRKGSKLAKLVTLLSRKLGVTLIKASNMLDWQKHTTSTTLTGFKNRSYNIENEPRVGKNAIYRIRNRQEVRNVSSR